MFREIIPCKISDTHIALDCLKSIRQSSEEEETPMKAKIGFVLFIVVFLIAALIAPLIDRMSRSAKRTIVSLSSIGEQLNRGARFFTKKVGIAEWKHFTEKAS